MSNYIFYRASILFNMRITMHENLTVMNRFFIYIAHSLNTVVITLYKLIARKNGFAERSKILATYRSEK